MPRTPAAGSLFLSGRTHLFLSSPPPFSFSHFAWPLLQVCKGDHITKQLLFALFSHSSSSRSFLTDSKTDYFPPQFFSPPKSLHSGVLQWPSLLRLCYEYENLPSKNGFPICLLAVILSLYSAVLIVRSAVDRKKDLFFLHI